MRNPGIRRVAETIAWSLGTILSLTGCLHLSLPEIHPAPGNACEVDGNPDGTSKLAPSFSIRHEVGGDADPTDDSRTIWIKPGEDLELIDNVDASTTLTTGQIYVLEVKSFTSPPSPPEGFLTGASPTPTPFEPTLITGTWDIPGFTIFVQPGIKRTRSTTVYLLDKDSAGNGFGYSFELGTALEGSGGTGSDIQVVLDPLGSHPTVPQMTVSYFFDGREKGSSTPGKDFYVHVLPRAVGSIGGFGVAPGDEYEMESVSLLDTTVATPKVTLIPPGVPPPYPLVPTGKKQELASLPFPTLPNGAVYFQVVQTPTPDKDIWLRTAFSNRGDALFLVEN